MNPPKEKDTPFWLTWYGIIFVLILAISAAAVVAAFGDSPPAEEPANTRESVYGVISEVVETGMEHSPVRVYVRYVVNGEEYEYVSQYNISYYQEYKAQTRVGTEMIVRYDPNNPEKATVRHINNDTETADGGEPWIDALIVSLMGLPFFAIGVFTLARHYKFMKTAEPVTGVITGISGGSRNKSVYVSYFAEGTEYEDIRLGEYSTGMRRGKEIELYYQPDNPERVRTGRVSPMLGLIFAGTGVFFFTMSILVIIQG